MKNPNRGVFDDDYPIDEVEDPGLRDKLRLLRANKIGLKQLVTELVPLFAHAQGWRFNEFVELGCWHGATAIIFSSFVKPGGRIVLVDHVKNAADKAKAERSVAILRESGFNVRFFNRTTRSVWQDVAGILRAIDYLHIDADHRYDGVRWDYDHYAPLVRKGGIIQLHDIAMTGWSHPQHEFGVHRLWAELKQTYNGRTTEIVDETYVDPQPLVKGHVGIGLIRV